jgi:hypothetical protein
MRVNTPLPRLGLLVSLAVIGACAPAATTTTTAVTPVPVAVAKEGDSVAIRSLVSQLDLEQYKATSKVSLNSAIAARELRGIARPWTGLKHSSRTMVAPTRSE